MHLPSDSFLDFVFIELKNFWQFGKIINFILKAKCIPTTALIRSPTVPSIYDECIDPESTITVKT